jgi:hypothetical protein
MLIHCLLDHDRQKNFQTQKMKKNEKHKGVIDVKLTYEAKCSHKWTKAYNLYKYKTSNPPKTIVKHHQFVLGVL